MESSFYNLPDLLAQFVLLSVLYALLIGIPFLLIKLVSQATPSPYTLKTFLMLCVPGVFYCFLESFAEHQAWNFLMVLFYLLLAAIIQMLLIRRIALKSYLIFGCSLALMLWLITPKASMKMF